MNHLFGSSRAIIKSAALLLSSRSSNHFIVRNRASYFCYHGDRRAAKSQRRHIVTTSYPHRKISDPLHILFCGSDDFSCASLQALHDEHVRNPDLIRSIDVVVRPGKPTGRGWTVIRDPPIRSLATSLGLEIHERDTFTGWDMPSKTNLIIAVSFGLWVPPRLLSAAKYGGLNLHPSLLPNLRGPAPLHHALLAGHRLTGVTLQTLDDKAYDHGVVLAQTPSSASRASALFIPPTCTTVATLQSLVTPVATRMLIDGLRAGLHVPPLQDRGWKPTKEETAALLYAPKITPQDRQLTALILRTSDGETTDPTRQTHGVLARRQAAIGPLWFFSRDREGRQKRVIVDALEEVPGLSPADRPSVFQVVAPPPPPTPKSTKGKRTDTWSPLPDPPRLSLRDNPFSPIHNHTQYLVPFEYNLDDGTEMSKRTQKRKQHDGRVRNLVFWDTAAIEDPAREKEKENKDKTKDMQWNKDMHGNWGWHERRDIGRNKTWDKKKKKMEKEKTKEQEEEKEKEKRDGYRTDAPLYLGNYRILSLKVEGESAKPPRMALRSFFISES